MAPTNEEINKTLKISIMIWIAMLSSLLIAPFVFYFFKDKIQVRTDIPIELLRTVFYALSVMEFVIAYFLRRFVLKANSEKYNPVLQIGKNPNSPVLIKYTKAVIVSLGIVECFGIYGFILFLLGDSFIIFCSFIAISIAGMLFFRPNQKELESVLKQDL
ncbi:MAG: hypothetical protein HQK76_03635 [Desulfobacterales bacterium]|nr:hypothetical protein [Desulfobacterales bacterium]